MKLHKEDPRLTAYILGELSPEDALAVTHAIAGDPALRFVLAEAEREQMQLIGLFGGAKDELLPRQRESIRRAAKEAARNGKLEYLRSHRQARKVWLVPLAAAAVIAFGIFIISEIPQTKVGGKGVTGNSAKGVPRAAAVDVLPGNSKAGAIRLPLHTGKKSLAKISAAVRVARRKPSVDEVSVPEMLNSFPLKASGSAAIKGGCKLVAEIIPCPWKPSGSLIFVEVRGAKDVESGLSVEYHGDSESVMAHTLIGYNQVSDGSGSTAVSKMDPNSVMLLMIEVDARTQNLGELLWSVNGEAAPKIPLVSDPVKEPSDDSRFAALVCGFGQWLRGEDRASLDESIVLGLAREVTTDGLAADRFDFLDLVDQAIKLDAK